MTEEEVAPVEPVEPAKPKFGGGGGEKCRKCSKTVYVAEKLSMQGQIWHIECLRCVECNKKLSGANWGGFVDPDGENKAYCSIHFNRLALTGGLPQEKSKWEQKQEAGGGSSSEGSSSTTSSSAPRFGGGAQDKCTGCNKTVYVAEKLMMQGQVWHIDCLKCVDCNRKLSGANWGGFVPPDNKPYCNNHYNKLVAREGGATAFSGSTGTWTPKTTTTPSTTTTTPGRYGGGGEDKCTGCGKRCYQAEKMKMEGQVWHPTCLRCIECTKMLSGANWGGFVPPDSKPYCKIHYDRLVQQAGSSVDFSGSTATGSKWQINSKS